MTKAMAATTKSLATSNQQMNVKQMQGLMNAYEKESMKMDMGTEMSIGWVLGCFFVYICSG